MTDATESALAVIDETILETPEAEAAPVEPEQTEEDEAAEEPDETEDLHDGKKRDRSAKARINERTRQLREAERERDYYKSLATQTAQPSGDIPAEKPTADNFDTYDDFLEALTDWKVGQRLTESQATSAKANEQHFRTVSWEAKAEAVRATLTDYDTVVGSSDIPIAGHVADALLDSDKGPELAYHMAQHPEIAARLNALSPVKAAIEMGRLETQLAAPVVKPASKAPAPVSPARGGSSANVNLAKSDMDTYIAERRKMGARY